MRILGISNPNFIGVTAATKAIVTDYIPLPHQNNVQNLPQFAAQLAELSPDILVVGGWSIGYDYLLKELKKIRRFPVITVYHGTHFHGDVLGDDNYLNTMSICQAKGEIDFMGYVQPQTANYYQEVHDRIVMWVPHSFKSQEKIKQYPLFKIGVFGGSGWYKNIGGVCKVAQEFSALNSDCSVITQTSYDKPRNEFHSILKSCSLIIHNSHLECYSNTIQEAWSYGIPTIMSWANVGLIHNPLFTAEEQEQLSLLAVQSNIDPMELHQKIKQIKSQWSYWSDLVYNISGKLHERTNAYTMDLFKAIITSHKTRKPRIDVFKSPFKNPKIYTGEK